MTPVQKKFLAKLDARMKGAPEKEIADFLQKLIRHPPDLWACLEAFMTVSAKYGIERTSMSVYWGVASLALVWCEPYSALEFEYRSQTGAHSEWSKRYAALPEYAVKEATSWIAKQKKKASSIDFRRLERFKEAEEDVQTAKRLEPPPGKRHLSRQARKFLQAFHKYMSIKTRAARLVFDKVLESLKGAELEACLNAYVEDSSRYAVDDAWSLYTFFALSSQAMHRCSAYLGLKYQNWIKPETKSTYAKLYAHLDPNQISQLASDFTSVNKRARILDELRYAYYKAYGKDPDDRALRDFEAVKNDHLRTEVSGTLAQYDHDCEANDMRGFNLTWDEFAKLMENKDRLTLVMMVKWCRDWLSADRTMRDELYWHAVGALFVKLLLDRPEVYRHGYSDEEKAYFISLNQNRHPYLDDFLRRLRYLSITRQMARFSQLCKVHAALILYGAKRNMRLATMSEAEKVLGNVERVQDHGPSPGDILSVPVTQREGLLKDRNASVSVGETFGDIAIVWFDGRDTAFVECKGLEKVLFVLHENDYTHQLGDLTNARFYDKLHEGTKGLLVLIPAFFEILSYLPDLVSGGLTGLAKSIALQYVINEGAEAVFGDSEAAAWVASAVSLGTGHLTQTQSSANRNIAAQLRATELLGHGTISARGLSFYGIEDVNVSGARFFEGPHAVKDLAVLELHVLPQPNDIPAPLPGHEPPPRSRAENVDPYGRLSLKEHTLPLREQRELEGLQHDLASNRGTGGGKGSRKRVNGTANNGVPVRAPAAPAGINPNGWYGTPPFTRDGVRFQVVGRGSSFLGVESNIATRYQVYEIRDYAGKTVYVGITGGVTNPRSALDRLPEHLFNKNGEFLGDAHSLHVVGVNLDERVARALEDSLIDHRQPHWNNRARDPQSYERQFGEKPGIEEVRRAYNSHFAFRIDIL